MAASNPVLADQLLAHNLGVKGAAFRAEELAERLVSEDGFTAAYASDHAEEELEWIAAELDAAAKRIRALKDYTVTGAVRRAQLQELATRAFG